MDKSYDKSNVIKTLETMITCNKMQAEGYPECVKDCDNCSLLYEQGNFEERIETLEMAIKALEQMPVTTTAGEGGVIYYPQVEGVTPTVIDAGKQERDAIDRKLVCAFIDGLISDDGERKKALQYINELPSVNPQPCEDAISRQYLIDIATKDGAYDYVSAQEIANAPSVTPQPNTGHWIDDNENEIDAQYGRHLYRCSKCNEYADMFIGGTEDWWDLEKPNYCPNCGAKMVEPQESEE